MIRPIRAGFVLLSLLVFCIPHGADAQVRRGRAIDTGPGWVPISVAAQIGYDQSARGGGTVLGAGAQIPLLSNGYVKLLPTAQVTFVRGGRDHQYGLEAVFVTGGRRGGLYTGGGIGKRTGTQPFSQDGIDDVSTWNVVAGVTSGFAGRFQTILEFRWIKMDGFAVKPTPVTLGISLPLWTVAPPGS